jgi:hypothetical protein
MVRYAYSSLVGTLGDIEIVMRIILKSVKGNKM